MIEKCQNCRFFQMQRGGGYGVCRRYAPSSPNAPTNSHPLHVLTFDMDAAELLSAEDAQRIREEFERVQSQPGRLFVTWPGTRVETVGHRTTVSPSYWCGDWEAPDKVTGAVYADALEEHGFTEAAQWLRRQFAE